MALGLGWNARGGRKGKRGWGSGEGQGYGISLGTDVVRILVLM
jgi:hypothetical protein